MLGGGGGQRDLGVDGVIDLERIDPAEVSLPTWYRPNPGLARETAFVLFTGDGPSTRARMITNARWARAAFGTAASAELGPRDTVFSVNPIHHPSGLLMSLGGAVASGARFSMASRFDPDTFWNEARRYGVTVVSYTWTQLRDLVEAPPHPGEHHHTIRTFIGSGMPVGLWHRVIERFAPARVVEYYASAQTDAILVNMPGAKVGCMGTPLPGSPELRIARIDESTRQLALRADGSAEQCRPREIGMLLSRVEPGMSPAARPHRGLFAPGDAWLLTGDLFYRDEDGDFWLAGSADSLVTTAHGVVGGSAVEDALGILDAIDMSVTYAVPGADGDDLAVTAITLRSERSLDAEDLSAALGQLPPDRRPHVVRIVERIPTSTSHRPLPSAFAEGGRPAPGPGVYNLDPLSGEYRTDKMQSQSELQLPDEGADDEPGIRLRLPDCRVRLRRQRIGAAPGRKGLSGSRFGVRASFRGPRLRRAALPAAPDDLRAEAGFEGHSAGHTVQGRHDPQRKRRGRWQPGLRADPLASRRWILR